MRKVFVLIMFTCLCVLNSFAQQRVITQVKGDVYRFQNNGHYSVFMVTPEGIIVTDPINKEAAEWLNEELKKRFDVPVKYLIYSHDHADHISGGEAFGSDVIVISQETTKRKIISEKRLTPIPDITFNENLSIELGDKKVELYFPGKSHGDNCIAMLFPEEKILFAVDFISTKRFPYRDLPNSHIPDWINSIQKIESLDFEIFVPGHGDIGRKADVVEHREYFQSLQKEVQDAIDNGQSLEKMKKTIKLSQYKHFGQYDAWFVMNIEGMYRILNEK